MTTPNARAAAANRPTARTTMKNRPLNELEFTGRFAVPDGPRDPETNKPIPGEIHCELRRFTLAERQLVKRIMQKFASPPDWDDVIVAHAFVVWRRTHPEASLQYWMDHIQWGDLLDGLDLATPASIAWDTTPEHYDPNLSGTA